HGRFGDGLVQYQGALDLRRAEAVAGDIEYVVDAAGDPVIAVGVAARPVTREIHAGVGPEIGVDETPMISVDRAHLAGPGTGDDQIAFTDTVQRAALGVDDRRHHTEERQRGGTRLQGRRAGQ